MRPMQMHFKPPWAIGQPAPTRDGVRAFHLFAAMAAVGLFFSLSVQASARAVGRLTIVGDSISAMSRPELAQALTPRYRVTFDTMVGTFISTWLGAIQSTTDTQPKQGWVIELGTNDTRLNEPGWPTYFHDEVQALSHQPCVVFVTVNPRIGQASRALDADIAKAVGNHPNFHSLDWGNIEWQNPKAWLMPDFVHPTPAGSTKLATLESQTLPADCPHLTGRTS